jgi:hypothetical protein
MPSGFPSDFPIYAGSRLTAAAINSGGNGWTMEWQTLDKVSKIQAFYIGALDGGDWMLLTYSGTVETSFSATFRRKSNAKATGSVQVAISGGVTKISLTLTTAS